MDPPHIGVKGANMKHKVSLGIPSWGTQSPDFWQPAIAEAAQLYKYDIELVEVISARSMSTDNNRNEIVSQFLASRAEWLAWKDTDNSQPISWIPRLLDGDRPLSGGIYFRRDLGRPEPIAYQRGPDGRYKPISGYTRGEIIPVDAAGMNCTLVHRTVYETIQKHFEQYITTWGSRFVIHEDDIQGYILDNASDITDNQVIDGQLRIRLRPLPHREDGEDTFPFFRQEYNRTEDMPFYEDAQRVGYQMWLDTIIECKHYADVGVDGSHYREWIKEQIKKGEWKGD